MSLAREQRRMQLVFAAIALVAIAFTRVRALEALVPGSIYPLHAISTTPRGGAARIETSAGARFVDVSARIETQSMVLFALDNANTTFELDARYTIRPPCGEAFLVDGEHGVPSARVGFGLAFDGRARCVAAFTLDAAAAARVARELGIPRQERQPLGEAVVGAFRPSQSVYRRGAGVDIVFAFENPSSAPMAHRIDPGHSPRMYDPLFSFVVRRDGQPVSRRNRGGYGGITRIVPVMPGATGELRASLGNWVSLEPGAYEVQCAHEMTFAREGVNPVTDDAHRGAIWVRRFEGVVRFAIR
jgi:hypothetical protein